MKNTDCVLHDKSELILRLFLLSPFFFLILGTVVIHHFPSIPSYNVSFISQTQVGDSQAWHSVTVWYRMQCMSLF